MQNLFRNRNKLGCVIDNNFSRYGSSTKNRYRYTDVPYVTFKMTRNGSFSSQTVGSDTGDTFWDFGDGTPLYKGVSPSHTFSNGAVKTVKVYCSRSRIAGGVLFRFSIYTGNAGLTGTIDLSHTNNLAGTIYLDSTSNITEVKLPATEQQNITNFLIEGSKVTSLDLSCITKCSAYLIDSNTLLTTVTFGTAKQNITSIYINSCALTGTLDFTPLGTYFGGYVRSDSNTNLTSVSLPTSSRTFTALYFNNCNLTGTLDISTLSNIGADFRCQSNTGLTTLTLPSSIAQSFTIFNAGACALNLASVNAVLSKLNTYYSSHAPTQNLTLTLNGGTNSSPTGGVFNTDLLNLQSVFTSAGKIFNYSIN